MHGQRLHEFACYPLAARDQTSVTVAVVVPEWGANVVGFSYRDYSWSWPLPVLEPADFSFVALKPTSYGMPILAPTPGRVGCNQNGVFVYRGKTYRIDPSRHGFLRILPWRPVHYSDNAISCEVQVSPDLFHYADAYPFCFRALHDVQLEPQSLRSRVSIVNTGTVVIPVAVGWHPYLHRSGACRVGFPASARWELDGQPEPTPTGTIMALTPRDDFRGGRVLRQQDHWDDVFTNIEVEDSMASFWVEESTTIANTDGAFTRLIVRRSVDLPTAPPTANGRCIDNVQLYTPSGRNAICIEPLSAPPDGINLLARGHDRHGVLELPAGDSVYFEIAISIAFRPTEQTDPYTEGAC